MAKCLMTDEAIHLSRVHNRTLSLDEEQEIFTKMFAELIVQECVDMFSDDLNSMRDYTGKACRYMIKEHFGLTKTVVAE